MRSPKSRSRSKNNRNRPPSGGNIINRVFDSSGPEGKVRGTPQQIIDKYQSLARDAQLSNDRVAAENFLQHAEHYTRMLGEAQREMDERRLQQEREHQARLDRERQEREAREAREARRAQHQERVEPRAEPRPEPEEARPALEPERREPERREPERHEPRHEPQVAEAAGEQPEAGPIETPEERKRTRRPRSRRPAADAGRDAGQDEPVSISPSEAAE